MNSKGKSGLVLAFWVFVAVLFALAPVPRAEAASPFGTGTDGDLVVNSGETVYLDYWYNTRYGPDSYLSTPDAVPNFRNVIINSGGTLTVSGYNSSTGKGGRLAFKASENVVVNGSITVAGLGFPGGRGGRYSQPIDATAGEGPGGGARGTNHYFCAENGTGGTYQENISFYVDLDLGSGGGGGGYLFYKPGSVVICAQNGGDGGAGGGSISIQAKNIVIRGLVSSQGADGGNSSISYDDDGNKRTSGGGGGGSGGSITIKGDQVDVGNRCLSSLGGRNKLQYGQVGDYAGNGRIDIFYDTSFSGTTATPATVSTIDVTPPRGVFAINDGSEFTTTALVNLTFTAQDNRSGVAQVVVSNDNFQTQQVFSYQPQITWTLTPDKGPKQVWVKFIDAAGNESDPVSRTVTLVSDTTPPAVNLLINEGAQVTDSPNVRLLVNAVDDYSSGSDIQVRLSNDGRSWTQFASLTSMWMSWDLADSRYGGTAGDGFKTVYLQAKDAAGNVASTSAQIAISTSVPSGTPGSTEGAVGTLPGTTVEVLPSARARLLVTNPANVAYASYSFDGVSWSPWEKPTLDASGNIVKDVAFPGGDGRKALFFKFKNQYGAESGVYVREFVLDTTPPDVTLEAVGGAKATTTGSVRLSVTASDAVSKTFSYSLDGVNFRALPGDGIITVSGLDPGSRGRLHVIKVYVRDLAGNTALKKIEIWSLP